MKILLCHNFYQQRGGEDQVFADERWLLREQGHEVREYTRHNDDVDKLPAWQKLSTMFWNPQTVRDLEALFCQWRPEIMHCTNTFPLISPAAYEVAWRHGVKVVQSIHNYRWLCPAATFARAGAVCESCLGKLVAWPGIQHGCYRDSRAATAALAAYQTYHRLRKTWWRRVDRIIALTDFSRDKLIEGGLPADRMSVKRNFVHPDPGPGEGQGDYLLFVGRLAPEKGIDTLLKAWASNLQLPLLKIAGGGPLAEQVATASRELPHVQWLGPQPLERVYELVGAAQALVVPSIWYEVCPKTILESYAKGTPVIASDLGGMAELVRHGITGYLFPAGDPSGLQSAVQRLVQDPERRSTMRQLARQEFQDRYTATENYRRLQEIYAETLGAPPTTRQDNWAFIENTNEALVP